MRESERKLEDRVRDGEAEANRMQNIHFIGLLYRDGEEKEVYHNQRYISMMQASKMATMQSMSLSNRVSCVNILTDSEYEQYRAQKEENKDQWG